MNLHFNIHYKILYKYFKILKKSKSQKRQFGGSYKRFTEIINPLKHILNAKKMEACHFFLLNKLT